MFRLSTYRPDPGLARPSINLYLYAGGGQVPDEVDDPNNRLSGDQPSVASEQKSPSADPSPAPVSPSLIDYEATQVWDAIIKRLRTRPSAGTPPSPPVSGPTSAKLEDRRRFWHDY